MAHVYILECLTNLHVGGGENNYSVIDKQVERDEVTGYPTIYASSLKGALRENFVYRKQELVDVFFGSNDDKTKSSIAGQLKFLEAKLFAMPVRASRGKRTNYLTTSWELIEAFVKYLVVAGKVDSSLLASFKQLNVANSPITLFSDNDGIAVEGSEAPNSTLTLPSEVTKLIKQLIGDRVPLVVLPEADFRALTLPVRARNNRQSGKENLWYEEHVPYGSLFYTLVLSQADDGSDKVLEQFEQGLPANRLVQIGANASVGFGLVVFKTWEE